LIGHPSNPHLSASKDCYLQSNEILLNLSIKDAEFSRGCYLQSNEILLNLSIKDAEFFKGCHLQSNEILLNLSVKDAGTQVQLHKVPYL
jgi:hypothetical protein